MNTFAPFVIELEDRPEPRRTPAMQIILNRMLAYMIEQMQTQEEAV